MAISKEQMSRLEKDANQLIQNLKLLYDKAGSFNTAKESLNETNKNLQQFISVTGKLSEQAHTIIQNLGEIGVIKISEQLDSILSLTGKISNNQSILVKRLLYGISIVTVLQIAILITAIYM